MTKRCSKSFKKITFYTFEIQTLNLGCYTCDARPPRRRPTSAQPRRSFLDLGPGPTLGAGVQENTTSARLRTVKIFVHMYINCWHYLPCGLDLLGSICLSSDFMLVLGILTFDLKSLYFVFLR